MVHDLVGQDLDGDVHRQVAVLAQKDAPGPAAPQRLQDPVALRQEALRPGQRVDARHLCDDGRAAGVAEMRAGLERGLALRTRPAQVRTERLALGDGVFELALLPEDLVDADFRERIFGLPRHGSLRCTADCC
jgi:hypothetical protein